MWTRKSRTGKSQGTNTLQLWALVVVIIGGLLLAGCGESDPSFDSDRVESVLTESDPAAATAMNPAMPVTAADLFPEGPGRPLVLDNCGTCHAVACAVIGQRVPARWDNLKEGHRDNVSNLSQQDLETVFGYLKKHFNDSEPEPRVPPHLLEGGCTPF